MSDSSTMKMNVSDGDTAQGGRPSHSGWRRYVAVMAGLLGWSTVAVLLLRPDAPGSLTQGQWQAVQAAVGLLLVAGAFCGEVLYRAGADLAPRGRLARLMRALQAAVPVPEQPLGFGTLIIIGAVQGQISLTATVIATVVGVDVLVSAIARKVGSVVVRRKCVTCS